MFGSGGLETPPGSWGEAVAATVCRGPGAALHGRARQACHPVRLAHCQVGERARESE